jgi:RNA polymerase sigma factor (TIGR02999 family)
MNAVPDNRAVSDTEITQWLQQQQAPDPVTGRRLFEALYDELRRLARGQLRREDPAHTLSATALTHEAWFRLAEQTRTQWRSRGHFLAVAATLMRRILVNHAQARRAAKRDAELVPLTLADAELLADAGAPDLQRVHDALQAFESIDPRAARVVELRFFGGLEVDEIAEVLSISPATVKRDWTIARAWLHRDLQGG